MAGGIGPHIVLIFAGLLVSLLGGAMLAKPRRVARFLEQTDAVGSKHKLRDVEPTDWNVTLTRFSGGVVFSMSGFIFLIGGYVFLTGTVFLICGVIFLKKIYAPLIGL
ncbi:hypothetical protein [Haloferax profundi]|uniref:hypothetical protein n=1 Tax=Haloferax profundi TaxID=1544718 RepID=UPI0007336A28|nr:hypothetical protein [Haloferax profundi]